MFNIWRSPTYLISIHNFKMRALTSTKSMTGYPRFCQEILTNSYARLGLFGQENLTKTFFTGAKADFIQSRLDMVGVCVSE